MRRNNIRKTEALIMAFALSASLLLTGCGNSTGSKNTASNNASIVSSSNSVDNNNGSSGNKNTNGDSVNENNSTTDEAGVNHDYPVMLFSYDKNDTNYEEPEAFNSEHLGGNYGEIEKIEYYSPTTNATRNANVYLPYGYDKSKSYPVVYLLHGMSGTYEDYRVLGARPTAQNIVYEYNRNDMILVSFTVFTDVDGKQESDYGFSNVDLIGRFCAEHGIGDFARNVFHGLENAFAAETSRILVAEFNRFAHAGRSARGNRRRCDNAAFKPNFRFNGRT